jgi:hypothetical protein
VSLLATLINAADYPVYRFNVALSSGQTFQYFMVFNSGLPTTADDNAVMACAQAVKAIDWGSVAGIPAGTTTTQVQVVRATENTGTRTV